MRRALFPLFCTMLTGCSVASWAVVLYTIHDLGALGGTYSQARGINQSGQSAGSVCNSDWRWHAVLWQNGVLLDLGTLGGVTANTTAEDVNDSGHVVGGAYHAFLWDGTMQDLGTLGGAQSRAFGINSSGQVVGRADTSAGSYHAFLWQSGTMQDLGTLGGTHSEAQDINDRGQAVGWAEDASGAQRAFVWQNGRMERLGTLPGYSFQSMAFGINDNGQVVGCAKNEQGEQHGFVWLDGAMQDLGSRTEAFGINNAGQVVGRRNGNDAFVWQGGVMQDLGPLPGGGSNYALGINNNGSIVGCAYTSGGQCHAVLWEPVPIPSASVGGSKLLLDGTCVSVTNAVVTATSIESDSVFVESSDRSSGIKLVTSQSLSIGQSVQFAGTVGRVDGEYQISGVTFIGIGDGSPLSPVFMPTSTIGNDPSESLSYVGMNTTGLLVRTTGEVTGTVPPEQVIYVDDGAGYQCGVGQPVLGIRVHVPTGATLPSAGSHVSVTGVSRVERHTLANWRLVNGNWRSPGTVLYVPSIWLRDSNDLQVIPQ